MRPPISLGNYPHCTSLCVFQHISSPHKLDNIGPIPLHICSHYNTDIEIILYYNLPVKNEAGYKHDGICFDLGVLFRVFRSFANPAFGALDSEIRRPPLMKTVRPLEIRRWYQCNRKPRGGNAMQRLRLDPNGGQN